MEHGDKQEESDITTTRLLYNSIQQIIQYNNNCGYSSPFLKSLPHCVIKSVLSTEYIIRTQPEEGFVSTLEACAAAISIIQNDNFIFKQLTGIITGILIQILVFSFIINIILHDTYSLYSVQLHYERCVRFSWNMEQKFINQNKKHSQLIHTHMIDPYQTETN